MTVLEEAYDVLNKRKLTTVPISAIVELAPKTAREKLFADYDIKKLLKVFEDESLMETVETFLKNDLNVSRASRAMYMHRNTLMYRLNQIQHLTGLDLRTYDMAVTFQILYSLYKMR